MPTTDPRYAEKRRAAIHAKDVKRLNVMIPPGCPLVIHGRQFAGRYWSFYTNTGKGPMRFEVAAAYIDGYLAGWAAADDSPVTVP